MQIIIIKLIHGCICINHNGYFVRNSKLWKGETCIHYSGNGLENGRIWRSILIYQSCDVKNQILGFAWMKIEAILFCFFWSMDTKVDGRDPILNGVDFDCNLIGGKNRWCINFDQLYYYRNHCSNLNLYCTYFFIFLQPHIWQKKNSNVNIIEYTLLSCCLLITCIPDKSASTLCSSWPMHK